MSSVAIDSPLDLYTDVHQFQMVDSLGAMFERLSGDALLTVGVTIILACEFIPLNALVRVK